MGYEPEPNPAISQVSSERLASYVTGVIATLVAIGGLYLVSRLQASGWGLASYVIWLTVSGLLVVGIEALSRTV